MPAFDPGEASVELHVSFQSPEKRDEFMKTMLAMEPDAGGVRRSTPKSVRNIWSMWWPLQRDKRYDTEVVQGDGKPEPQLANAVGDPEAMGEVEAAIAEAKSA
jgi:hypothetical protein